MNTKKLILGAMIASAVTGAQAAPYGFFDARSVGMGNVSVATGNIAIAGLSNPAMLIVNENKDSFALLIPAVGVQVIDNGGFIDGADELQQLVDTFEMQINASQFTAAQNTYNAMSALVSDLDGDSLSLNANANLAMAFAGENWAFAGTFRGYGAAGIGVFDPVFPAFNNTVTNQPSIDFQAAGVLVQEVGLSIATKFNVMGMDLSVGLTPKNVSVETMITNVLEVNSQLDTDDPTNDAIEENLGSFTTLDAGVVLNVTDSITLGLVAKNLMSESFTSSVLDPDGNPYTFNFDTHMRAGAAYHNDWFTLAADMDLTEIEPLSFEDPSKMMALGVEFNAWDFMQIRAGYQTNMASGADEPALYSAGIGLWLGFHLDVAAVVGEDSSFGAMAQLGFRF